MEENDYYILFVLGYDLLHKKLEKCEYTECDTVWDTLQDVLTMYKVSKECHDFNKSQYDTLVNFIENHKFEIDTLLFNKLNYKGEII